MKYGKLTSGISRMTSEARFLRVCLLGLIMITVLMSIRMITTDTEIKVSVVAPAAITKDFWISTNGFGPRYLEQIGTFIAYMVLNATPASMKFQSEQLKPYLAPEAYGKLFTDMEAKHKRFMRYQMATVFYPEQILLSKSHCHIQVEGMLKTFIGGKSGSSEKRKLDIGCKNVNGRFYVTSLELIDSHTDSGRAS